MKPVSPGVQTRNSPTQSLLPPEDRPGEAKFDGAKVKVVDAKPKIPSRTMGLSESMAKSLAEYKITRRDKVRKFLFLSTPVTLPLLGMGLGGVLGSVGLAGGPFVFVTVAAGMAIGGLMALIATLKVLGDAQGAGDKPVFDFLEGFNFNRVEERRNQFNRNSTSWEYLYEKRIDSLEKNSPT